MVIIKNLILLLFISLSLRLQASAQKISTNKSTNKILQQKNLDTKTVSYINSTVSYQGLITIPADIDLKMRQEGHTAINSIPGNPIKVQLWKVVYQADSKKNGYTEILLQQQINSSNFSLKTVTGGISFKMDALPSGNNLAIIVFSNKLNSVPSLAIKGRPDDGNAQNILHHYESDAKKDLGQNIVYGIYSITPGKTDMNHLDFTFFAPSTSAGQNTMGLDIGGIVSDIGNEFGQMTKKVINGVEYVFDQTVDGVSGLAKLVANGVVDAADFLIDQTGTIYYSIGGTLINLIAYGNLPRERSLRQDEYDWANKMIFNGNLPDIGLIRVFNFMSPLSSNPTSFQNAHRYYTWPSPDGKHIFMNIGDAFDNPMGTALPDNGYPGNGQVLIHELSHAWQIKKYGITGMIQKYFGGGGLSQNYDPDCTHNSINSNFNIEQEATIVDRTFLQLYYHQSNSYSCTAFEQQYTENHVRNGVKFDVAKINATIAMQLHAKAFLSFIGNVENADATYSAGNGRDGDGYFMLGPIPWSVVYYTNKDGKAYANWGEIRKKYNSMNSEHGGLGWPQTDIISLRNNGSFQHFQHGSIYSTPQFGTFIVEGFILDAWDKINWEKGELGYPISDFIPDNNSGSNSNKLLQQTNRGGYQKFEHGIIRWSGIPGSQAEVVINNTLLNSKNKRIIH